MGAVPISFAAVATTLALAAAPGHAAPTAPQIFTEGVTRFYQVY